jgi:hypothetical protein
MSQLEFSRLAVIQQVERKELKQDRAAALLNLSVRQVKRLLRAYKAEGAEALVSKHRGRPSNHQLGATVVATANELLQTRYFDFGPTLAHEKLVEDHALQLSVESVRHLMIVSGLWQARRAHQPVIHQLRERRSQLGALVQIDGSPHDWFEGRAPKCTLLVFVDDATGRLMQLWFAPAETTFAYFTALESYILQHGKPLALYSDKYGVFRVNQPSTLPDSPTSGLTQFGRAMKELAIDLICAHSPQAKGRVERANQTLQDRLVKELRLRGLSNIAEANAFLPEFAADFNMRFAVMPRDPTDAHRPLLAHEDLARTLVHVEHRTLSKNLTLSYNKRIYQIETKRAAYTMRGAQVEVREARDRSVTIEYQRQALVCHLYREQEQEQGRVLTAKLIAVSHPAPTATRQVRQPYHPSPQHPWRRDKFGNYRSRPEPESGDISTLDK